MEIPFIDTGRCTVTVLAPKDAPLLAAYYQENRQHIAPWEPVREESFYTVEAARSRLAVTHDGFRKGFFASFALLHPETGAMVGACNFSNIVRGVFQACNMGYSIHHSHEGTGLMREGAQACIGHMFGRMELHRIMANHLPANERSARLLARLGFEREGYAKAYLKIAGKWEDHVLNALVNPAL